VILSTNEGDEINFGIV